MNSAWKRKRVAAHVLPAACNTVPSSGSVRSMAATGMQSRDASASGRRRDGVLCIEGGRVEPGDSLAPARQGRAMLSHQPFRRHSHLHRSPCELQQTTANPNRPHLRSAGPPSCSPPGLSLALRAPPLPASRALLSLLASSLRGATPKLPTPSPSSRPSPCTASMAPTPALWYVPRANCEELAARRDGPAANWPGGPG